MKNNLGFKDQHYHRQKILNEQMNDQSTLTDYYIIFLSF